jgi:hypothetical protein
MIKPGVAFGLGVAALVVAAAAPAQELADELKEKTVMITVEFSKGQPPEQGSGVVLCQQDDKVWILTANHVFAGKSTAAWEQVRLSRIASATISFYRNSPAPIVADSAFLRGQAAFYTFKPEDLLLLAVPLAERLPSAATLAPPPSEGDEQTVVSVGYRADRGASWAGAGGELVSGSAATSKFLYHTGDVHEGFSGGPVFNAAGELVGINVQRVPGEQTPDGEAGAWYGMAQSLDHQDVLAVLDKWVPARCLKSAGALGELAHLTYRRAMRAVSTRRWAAAEALMRQAIEQQPLEGGSVHLEGMRYTRYLPRYHLGLALYKLGRSSDAIREWERSEAQGEIQEDKRYKTLKRLRERAYEALRRAARDAAVESGS